MQSACADCEVCWFVLLTANSHTLAVHWSGLYTGVVCTYTGVVCTLEWFVHWSGLYSAVLTVVSVIVSFHLFCNNIGVGPPFRRAAIPRDSRHINPTNTLILALGLGLGLGLDYIVGPLEWRLFRMADLNQ